MELNFGKILLLYTFILSIMTLVVALSVKIQVKENNDTQKPHTCRNKYHDLDELKFYRDSCVLCYVYMPDSYFYPGEKLHYNVSKIHIGSLYKKDANGSITFYRYDNVIDEDGQFITNTIKSEKNILLWQKCCDAAAKCCEQMKADSFEYLNESYCERQWDGWQCIPDTPVERIYYVPCPSYIYFYGEPPRSECLSYGRKKCFSNGNWEFRTKYESCGLSDTLKRRIYVNIGAFAISLVFLVPAVIIFLSYKQLRVPRVIMHRNLFVALIVNGIVVIIYKLVVSLSFLESEIVDSESCKFAFALTKYTRMATYMWTFCEGFYLHKLIVTAFAEEKRLTVYYILGWVFPVIPVTLYAIMRKQFSDMPCWMLPSEEGYEWIINIPMLLSIALNAVFLCNIIRVLITKLQAAHADEPSQYRKAVRATVVLVPLFGLHVLLTIYLPNHGACGAIEFYYYFSNLIDGLQGFIISLIFCYLNGEVLHLLKRSYQRLRMMNDPTGYYSRTSASTQMMSVSELPSTCGL